MTRILGPATSDEAGTDLREALRDLRGDVKELRRDLSDLDERFVTFQGRVHKRRGLARAADEAEGQPPASASEPSRHPDVVAILRRRGEGG